VSPIARGFQAENVTDRQWQRYRSPVDNF